MARFNSVLRLSKRTLSFSHSLNGKYTLQSFSPLLLSCRALAENANGNMQSAASKSLSQASDPPLGGVVQDDTRISDSETDSFSSVKGKDIPEKRAVHSPPPLGDKSQGESLSSKQVLIAEILSRDKEIFELKRQHELSMLRVEYHQRRILKDQEDRGMYYEQNCNVHTFDTVSVGLHSQRATLYHTISLERLRNFKIILSIFVSMFCCWYIYYRYMVNPDFTYIEKPMKVLGSRVQAIREMNWDRMSDKEKLDALSARGHH